MLLRVLVTCAALAPLGAIVASCGDDDSVAECEEERTTYADKQACMSDATFQACIACHDECGDSCGTVDTACPFTYTCPE